MKKRALLLLFVAVLALGMASCRKHKESCAAYDRVEQVEK